MESTTIDVATSFDSRVELAAIVMLSSLRRHTSLDRKIRCHLIVDGLSDAAEALCNDMQDDHLEIKIYRITKNFANLETRGYITVGSYLRFLIPEVLQNYDKVLYLDIDLVAKHDIASLFDIDLGDMPLAAMPDHGLSNSSLTRSPWRFAFEGKEVTFANYCRDTLHVPTQGAAPYFNAGVMLLSLKQWREQKIAERALEVLELQPTLRFIDQDALNYVVRENYIPIDARWNACAFHTCPLSIKFLDLFDSKVWRWRRIRLQWRHEPWIVHFAGPNKPWWPTTETSPLDPLWWEEARHYARYDLVKAAFLEEFAKSGVGLDKSAE